MSPLIDVTASKTSSLLHCSFLGLRRSELGFSVGSSGSGSGLGFGVGVGSDLRLPERLKNSKVILNSISYTFKRFQVNCLLLFTWLIIRMN